MVSMNRVFNLNADFQDAYTSFIDFVRKKYGGAKIFKEFNGNSESLFSMIKSALQMLENWPEFPLHLKLIGALAGKDNVLSKKHREQGNAFFCKNQLFEAIKQYNYSIIYAVHPTKDAGDEVKHRDTLALAFANRSAVLYLLEMYELALDDIERAVHYGYPNDKMNKLVMRKIKCSVHIELKKQPHTMVLNDKEGILLKAMNQGFKEMGSFSLKEEENTILRKFVTELAKEGQVTFKPTSSVALNAKLYKNNFPQVVIGPAPTLAREHDKVKGLSSSANIEYRSDRGRCLVAKENIMPGKL